MNFPEMLLLIISFVLSIWVVKASAQLAYKQEVTWEQAFLQWLLLLILAFLASILLSLFKFGYLIEALTFKLF
ncbi:MAG: hypothetical protein J7J87_00805 [Candidatus Diapherotrites archaeon]|nr:hypothetical protein [Candidatus Diapherotrites archaeon]